MRTTKIYIFIFLTALSQVLGAQVIDLSSEPAFAPRVGSLIETQISLGMKIISNNRILISSDLYTRCDDARETNVYTILEIDTRTGVISNRRAIPALPHSFSLMLDANQRPLLVSKSSIHVLAPTSLKTTETIDLNGPEADAEDANEKVQCAWNGLRTSATLIRNL